MTIEEIIARIQGNEAEQTAVVNVLSTLPIFQTLLNNKAEALYSTKIGTEIKKVHDQYDADILSILNQSPGTNEDGSKQKSYDHIKQIATELKELRAKAESLITDAEVRRLTEELEKAKKGGNNEVMEKQITELRTKLETQDKTFKDQIKVKETELETFKKQTLIDSGLRDLKFNPDVDDELKKMVLDNVTNNLTKGCKFGENGELIFVDDKGEPILNETQNVASVSDMISKNGALSSILLKTVPQGGGAPDNPGGKSGTRIVKIKGQDVNGVTLNGFKTQTEFNDLLEKSLIGLGHDRTSEAWRVLETEAYETYKVDSLPSV